MSAIAYSTDCRIFYNITEYSTDCRIFYNIIKYLHVCPGIFASMSGNICIFVRAYLEPSETSRKLAGNLENRQTPRFLTFFEILETSRELAGSGQTIIQKSTGNYRIIFKVTFYLFIFLMKLFIFCRYGF